MKKLEQFTLKNSHGMQVDIINFGARIGSIKFPIGGKLYDMTIRYDDIDQFINDKFYVGATCGRVSNRISNGTFELYEKTYQLTKNEGENCLHGGMYNYSARFWEIVEVNLKNNSISLKINSENGDQGFPGQLDLIVCYKLTVDNKLIIKYQAHTDISTPISITNHSYFSLGENNCNLLQLQLMSSCYLELDSKNLPTGKIVSVENSQLNFRQPRLLGENGKKKYQDKMLKNPNFDHCFILDNSNFEQPKAILWSLKNDVKMKLFTDQPALQLYNGSALNGYFNQYQGICLEAQGYPDSVNKTHFPSTILTPDQAYEQTIIYAFSQGS